jgi:ATP-dependent Lon protease
LNTSKTNTNKRGKKSESPSIPSLPLPIQFPIEPVDNSNASTDSNNVYIVGRGELFCTGQMGDVMKESSSIAYTVAKRQLQLIKKNSTYFHQHRLHLHVPAGSTPKDGPSAGITMVTSLLSLALNTPIKQGLAMTGELTLTGKVLAIGGVKEKLMAAKHANVNEIILPKDNKKDYDECPEFIKQGLKIHFVDNYQQVFSIAFPNINNTNEINQQINQQQQQTLQAVMA